MSLWLVQGEARSRLSFSLMNLTVSPSYLTGPHSSSLLSLPLPPSGMVYRSLPHRVTTQNLLYKHSTNNRSLPPTQRGFFFTPHDKNSWDRYKFSYDPVWNRREVEWNVFKALKAIGTIIVKIFYLKQARCSAPYLECKGPGPELFEAKSSQDESSSSSKAQAMFCCREGRIP